MEIQRSAVLRYLNPKAPIIIQVDASTAGFGAVLLQNDIPVTFTSKTQSSLEIRYSNIEKRMLVVVFGLVMFHHHVWGHRVTIQTDHKPLESIALKSLVQAPPKLARMQLKIQGCDFAVKYRRGKTVFISDCLSRVPPRQGNHIEDINLNINMMNTCLNASSTRLQHMFIMEENECLLVAEQYGRSAFVMRLQSTIFAWEIE